MIQCSYNTQNPTVCDDSHISQRASFLNFLNAHKKRKKYLKKRESTQINYNDSHINVTEDDLVLSLQDHEANGILLNTLADNLHVKSLRLRQVSSEQ